MRVRIPIREYIGEVIHAIRFGVLATENGGQPYASLIAVTPVEGNVILLFATYRNTQKYTNLLQNGKVAILFENSGNIDLTLEDINVLTAYGHAEEVTGNTQKDCLAHLLRHPDLESFILSTGCAIFRVKVESYQVVQGIEDVKWWKINDPKVLC